MQPMAPMTPEVAQLLHLPMPQMQQMQQQMQQMQQLQQMQQMQEMMAMQGMDPAAMFAMQQNMQGGGMQMQGMGECAMGIRELTPGNNGQQAQEEEGAVAGDAPMAEQGTSMQQNFPGRTANVPARGMVPGRGMAMRGRGGGELEHY